MKNLLRALVVGSLLAAVGVVLWTPVVEAACDNVSIIRCGVSSQQDLVNKYQKNDRNAQKVYSAFGISEGDLNGFVDGTVHKDGRVVVDNKTVATDAKTAGFNWGEGDPGRQKISGTEAYIYSTNQLVKDSRRVMVKMENGQFKFAVIYDCGNPVKATPVAPTPPPVQPTPPPVKKEKPVKNIKVCDLTTYEIITIRENEYDESRHTTDLEECEKIEVCRIADKTIVEIARSEMSDEYTTDMEKCEDTPTPVAPVVTPPAPAPPQKLPETGIASVLGGGLGIGSIVGAGYYYFASRRAIGLS